MYKVSEEESGKCLIATELIHAGTKLFSFDPSYYQEEKTYQTIQVGLDRHYLAESFLVLLNHSCDPNLIVNTEKGLVYTEKDIYPGEELNYFYPTTEWDMARHFVCHCNSAKCIKHVKGAWWLPLNVLSSYHLNKHIVDLIIKNMNNPDLLQGS
ncbi:SET domain-containing protein-lysine N-methyltransferase [Bacillus shivajii]|uniref:SET domain-containing protein-lysine N-methyltransferase n=1 Tax=Bacillus shivajii TaxID=1983719 RepID=UPI001CF9E211|nr:SET domain-containing protein-lysine N-methyltransferase [Bacillus shivajii]UCZ52611.1 SET domain-containing protein-lysine N-methyltransferase [Bacillus shivajii]